MPTPQGQVIVPLFEQTSFAASAAGNQEEVDLQDIAWQHSKHTAGCPHSPPWSVTECLPQALQRNRSVSTWLKTWVSHHHYLMIWTTSWETWLMSRLMLHILLPPWPLVTWGNPMMVMANILTPPWMSPAQDPYHSIKPVHNCWSG